MALTKAKEIVSSNPVVVFSKTSCPYCVQVKKLLSQLGATYKIVELDEESDGSEIQSALKEWTGQRTVPNVFIGGNHIGGCDTVTAKHKGGNLVPLLTGAGAITADSYPGRIKILKVIQTGPSSTVQGSILEYDGEFEKPRIILAGSGVGCNLRFSIKLTWLGPSPVENIYQLWELIWKQENRWMETELCTGGICSNAKGCNHTYFRLDLLTAKVCFGG